MIIINLKKKLQIKKIIYWVKNKFYSINNLKKTVNE